jgi:signal transduction histidine kinase
MISETVDIAVYVEDKETITDYISVLRANNDIEYACVVNNKGEILGEYEKEQTVLSCYTRESESISKEGLEYLLFSQDVLWEQKSIGKVYLKVSSSRLSKEIENTIKYTSGVGLSVILLAILFSVFIQRFITRQILDLREVSRLIGLNNNYSLRAIKRSNDEVGDLVDSVNGMLERVEEQNEIINKHSIELEEKVKVRTGALAIANEELESFSYSVSHDLKVPIRSISGHALILKEEYGKITDEEITECIDEILESSNEMFRLIESLLEFSRFAMKKIDRSKVNINEIIERTIKSLEKNDQGRKVIFNIDKGMSCVGDKELVQIVINNLIDNAWKYTSKEMNAEITIGFSYEFGIKEFFIQDNGCGFDMRFSDRLFLPFKRMHTRSEYEGSGIGLATVKRVIEKHGGQIWAESKIGKGSVFYFTFENSKKTIENNNED